MFIAFNNRLDLLPLLPKGGAIAEIGVAEGSFSVQMYIHCKPAQLHLIDPWCHVDDPSYQRDSTNVTNDEGERRYRHVQNLFESQIASGKVVLHRDYSYNVCHSIEDRSLDWVFIDGMHTYSGALEDLRCFAPKIKDDGFILGHDFTNNAVATRTMEFGVVEAVFTFLQETGYQLVLITFEAFPTYIITKQPGGLAVERLLSAAFGALNMCIEIKEPLPGGFRHIFRPAGEQPTSHALSRFTMSFG